jgi:hypothetical protein
MGIFDGVFNTDPQQAAAAAQTQGIQTGYNQLADLFTQGRTAASNQYGEGQNALTNTTGTAANALTNNYYAGLSPFLQNYAQANQGSTALANALGLNGPQGNASAVTAFQNNPGYQFGLSQGEAAIDAAAQKAGMGASGNTLNAADQFAQNYANQNWQNYIQNLNPFLNFATNSAGGVQQGFSGLGQGLGNLYSGLGQNLNTNTMNLGNMLNQSFTNQGNAVYGANTSIGNANANAQLAQAGANANILGAIGGGAKALFSMI